MKHFTEHTEPAKQVSRLDKTTCDLCNQTIESEQYEVDEVELNYRQGSAWPGGGSGIKVEVDMCGECFKTKLMPWLATQGVYPQETDWDF